MRTDFGLRNVRGQEDEDEEVEVDNEGETEMVERRGMEDFFSVHPRTTRNTGRLLSVVVLSIGDEVKGPSRMTGLGSSN